MKKRWIGYKIEEILAAEKAYRKNHLKYSIGKDGTFIIEWGSMYEAPHLSFDKLKALSKLFGTEKIDVDGYAKKGCESCDWGSNYGHIITIEEPTKEVESFKKMIEDEKKPKTEKTKGKNTK
jgi:hypothetical protein